MVQAPGCRITDGLHCGKDVFTHPQFQPKWPSASLRCSLLRQLHATGGGGGQRQASLPTGKACTDFWESGSHNVGRGRREATQVRRRILTGWKVGMTLDKPHHQRPRAWPIHMHGLRAFTLHAYVYIYTRQAKPLVEEHVT